MAIDSTGKLGMIVVSFHTQLRTNYYLDRCSVFGSVNVQLLWFMNQLDLLRFCRTGS